MASCRGYTEHWLATADDPLRIVTRLAASGHFGQYVVYEGVDGYSFAGDVLAEVSVYSDRLRADFDGVPVAEEPLHGATDRKEVLRRAARLLEALPVRGWRAYGWASFEAAYALAGLDLETAGVPLLRLMIPRTEIRLRDGKALIRTTGPASAQLCAAVTGELPAGSADDVPPGPVPVEVTADDGYRDAVAAAVRDIRAGELQKVILSRVVPVGFPVDLIASYAYGRRHNHPARSFLISFGGLGAAGFSPETVAEVRDGRVVTQPLAGTRALSGDPATDRRLREVLLSDPKEVYEHAISVQAAVRELGTVSEPGTVRVDDFMNVRERGSVQHLASTVSGRLAAGHDAWDALRATFPAVTASGIPKERAYACIRRHEDRPRGLYSGVVMTVDANGDMDTALTLRTVYQQDGRAWMRAGAGIVAQSEPDREFEETCEKLRSVSRCLVPAGPPRPGEETSMTATAIGR
ncbi:salicylate synthase [Streptomyces sp. NPDC018019]|uniref:salicylate synthase n=1 Tax=Streptomyces sp. NPDC018019 TaxID=3365030 RepID=UPI0037B7A6CC